MKINHCTICPRNPKLTKSHIASLKHRHATLLLNQTTSNLVEDVFSDLMNTEYPSIDLSGICYPCTRRPSNGEAATALNKKDQKQSTECSRCTFNDLESLIDHSPQFDSSLEMSLSELVPVNTKFDDIIVCKQGGKD